MIPSSPTSSTPPGRPGPAFALSLARAGFDFEVAGPASSLLLAVCGRRAGLADLDGPGVAALAAPR